MPFIVAQMNVLFWGLAFLMLAGISIGILRGYPRVGPVLVALAIAYWLPATLFAAVPFQPYRGLFDRRGTSSLPKMTDLAELDRQVLVRFYLPHNRRRAVIAILAVSLLILAGWWISVTGLPPPKIPPLPASQLVAVLVGMGLPLAFVTGISVITSDVRRNWHTLSTDGGSWPLEVQYPGPLRASIRSFLGGSLPEFVSDPTSDVQRS